MGTSPFEQGTAVLHQPASGYKEALAAAAGAALPLLFASLLFSVIKESCLLLLLPSAHPSIHLHSACDHVGLEAALISAPADQEGACKREGKRGERGEEGREQKKKVKMDAKRLLS